MKESIEQLRAGIDLTPSEVRTAANFLADPQAPDEEKIAFLAALRDKGETGEEVGYFAQAFLSLAITKVNQASIFVGRVAIAWT